MTRDDAIDAIAQASEIFAHVVLSNNPEGSDAYTGTFRIAKVDALAAMRELGDPESEPNIYVSENGRRVTIGTQAAAVTSAEVQRASEFSHNDNNNGNF